jgi:hypothetical protein
LIGALGCPDKYAGLRDLKRITAYYDYSAEFIPPVSGRLRLCAGVFPGCLH